MRVTARTHTGIQRQNFLLFKNLPNKYTSGATTQNVSAKLWNRAEDDRGLSRILQELFWNEECLKLSPAQPMASQSASQPAKKGTSRSSESGSLLPPFPARAAAEKGTENHIQGARRRLVYSTPGRWAGPISQVPEPSGAAEGELLHRYVEQSPGIHHSH